MAVGLHSVLVYPDPSAGGWSAPLASNAYMSTDGTGWKAIPFGAGWTWSGGAMHSTNWTAAYQALGRDPAYPVNRPAGANQWRLRAEVALPSPVRVYALVRFGRTPNDAFQSPSGPDEQTLMTWWDLPAGTHKVQAQFNPAVPPPADLVYLSPQITLQPTVSSAAIGSMELTYQAPGGVDLSCLVDEVAVSHGRDGPSGQPEASAATITLTTDAAGQLPPDVDVGAVLVVRTGTDTATYDRFVGRITDVGLGWEDAGEDTPDAGVGQIIATGTLADLGRRVVGDVPWPQELDGARVNRIMTAAGVTLDPLVSDPGTVQLLPRDVDSTDALSAAHDAAQSASGILWQTRGGEVRYADAAHRRGTPPTVTLDACNLLVTPTWRRNTEGLVNSVSVGYGVPPDGGEQPRFVESAPASITKWGTYAYTASTDLADLADAQEMGRLLLTRNSSPVWVMAALPVDVAGLPAEAYAALLSLDVHALVVLTGLPAIGTAPTSATLWVEGWHETLTFGGHAIDLVVSGYCRTAPPPRWDDVSPATTWDTAPDITWDDAACLGPPSNFGRWNDQPATLRWDAVPPATTWNTYT